MKISAHDSHSNSAHYRAASEALNLCSIVKVSRAKVITIEAYSVIVYPLPTPIVYTLESALPWLETFLDRLRNRSIRAGMAERLTRSILT
jgi:hypothetical protein